MALRFANRKPKIEWVSVPADHVGAATGGGASSNYSGKAMVMAINDAGKRRVLETMDAEQSPEDRIAVIRADYESLLISIWCEKYDVQVSFAQE